MSRPGLVLILTHPDDAHADAVAGHLADLGVPTGRLDPPGVPAAGMVARIGSTGSGPTGSDPTGCLSGHIGRYDLGAVSCVWHRRPSDFTGLSAIDAAELRVAVGGILAGLPHLNHPADMARAGLKPYQLVAAARAGLNVPDTVVATDPAAAGAPGDQVVVKPMAGRSGGMVTAGDRTGWTRAAHLTQHRVEKAGDVRVTAVDRRLFATWIDSPHLDWRTDPAACGHRVLAVPEPVAAGTGRLLAAMRLRYAAIDFAVDHAGRWWFLEINPNGQWLWIEDATGLPISAAVAGALASPAPTVE